MKRTPFLFCLLWSLSLCLSACSDDDGLVYPPNVADAIPDGEFRVLCLQLADTDLNGVISKEEALAVRKIDCTPDPSYVKAISSLEGLHYFANLETLYCGGQLLTSIDLSGNPRLRHLDCSFDSLEELDVSSCSELETLSCSGCGLERLLLPRTATLTALDCSDNLLTTLDVTDYPALLVLYLSLIHI